MFLLVTAASPQLSPSKRHSGMPGERGGMPCECLTCLLFMNPGRRVAREGLVLHPGGRRAPDIATPPPLPSILLRLGSGCVSLDLCCTEDPGSKAVWNQPPSKCPQTLLSIAQGQGTEFTRATLPARNASSLGSKNLPHHWLNHLGPHHYAFLLLYFCYFRRQSLDLSPLGQMFLPQLLV